MKNSQLDDLCESDSSRSTWTLALVLSILVLASAALATQADRSAEINSHLHKAEAYLKANDPDSATKELNAVLALDPKNAEANSNLGVIAFFRRNYRSASQSLQKALAADPSLVKAQAMLGICQKRLGDPSAGALLEKSFAKLKDEQLQLQTGMELESLYDQQGEPERAVPVMQKLVDLNPDDVNILYMAQRLYQGLANDTLDKLAVLAPGSARMQQVIAERLVNLGDAEGAADHYKKALAIDPKLPGIHFELAQAVLESARRNPAAQEEAEKELASAEALDGDSASIECELGAIAILQSDVDKAYAHYTRAFAINPASPQAQFGLGQVLMTMEKPQDARKYLEMAVKTDPLNAAAHYRLGTAYRHLQMQEAAQREIRLFQEIKDVKDQVRNLYRQMKSQYHEDFAEIPDDEKDQPKE